MKKIVLLICAVLSLTFFTACGESGIVFTTQKFEESNIFDEYVNISSKYNNFISNFESVYNTSVTTEAMIFTNNMMNYKILQDLILFTMPVFEIGQPTSDQVVYYQDINFNCFSTQSPLCFRYFANNGQKLGAEYRYSVECDNAVWVDNNETKTLDNLLIEYSLVVSFNDSTGLNEYTIITSCEQEDDFSNTYIISFDDKTSYIFVDVKNNIDETVNMQVEYYSLSDDYQIARLISYKYVNFMPNYNVIDFMFKDYNGRVKLSKEGTVKPSRIKGLANVTYSDFARILDKEKQNETLGKYSYEIMQGRVSVDKFGSLI